MIAPRVEDSIATIASAHAVEMHKALIRLTKAFRDEEPLLVQPELDEILRRWKLLHTLQDTLIQQTGQLPPELEVCKRCGERDMNCKCQPVCWP